MDKDFQQALDLINNSQSILATTHTKPDGDAIGSLIALCEGLRQTVKKVQPLLLSQAPGWYDFLLDERVPVLGMDVQLEDLTAGRFGSFDLFVIVDTNTPIQLPEFSKYLKTAALPLLVFDHHRTADGLGALEVVRPDSASTGQVILDLFKFADWELTPKIAEALFVATSTDTGWFQFNNTDSDCFSACAELVKAGAKPAEIYHKVYENFSHPRFMLMIEMLKSLELKLDGRYAVMQITQQDFKKTGSVYADTDNLINQCRKINSVDTTALFTELKDGRIRCSLRSKGAVDVSLVAAKFGGGGHKMAAGAFVPGPMENARKLIYAEIAEKLGD